MTINRHNCEAFFLDYHEKNLSTVETAELLLFLEDNPDLKKQFEEYYRVILDLEKTQFPGKDKLKKKYSAEGINSLLNEPISTFNREEYFVAFVEGLLSENQKQDLFIYLQTHAEHRKELDLFIKGKLSDEPMHFESKHVLKKQFITPLNCEEFFIRFIEGDLSLWEQQEVELFLASNSSYKKQFELFKKTIITPEAIVFENKEALKRKKRKPIVVALFNKQTFYSAAAAILVLVGMIYFFTTNDQSEQYLTNSENITKQDNANRGEEPTVNKKQTQQTTDSKISSNNSYRQIKKELASVARGKSQKAQQNKFYQEPITEVDNLLPITSISITATEPPALQASANEDTNTVVTLPNQSFTIAAVEEEAKKTNADDNYETVASFVTKTLRKSLHLKQPDCGGSEKIGWWDAALLVKKGIQKLSGRDVNVDKVCNGEGDKVEYIFAAGNIEVSKTTTSK